MDVLRGIHMPEDTARERLYQRKYQITNVLLRNCLCEFVATTFLMYTGLCVNAQTVLSRSQMNENLGLSLGWGFCIIFAVQMGYKISGSHLNPAVSFFIYSFGQLPFTFFVCYSIAQTMGAFFGSFLTFLIYYEKITEFDGGKRSVVGLNATAGIFATYPGEHLSITGSIIDQVSCTAVMCIIIGIITDERNKIPKWAQPTLTGVMLMTIVLGFALNAGNAMNPARDFGPRLFTFLAGYGWEVISYRDYGWFWVPIVCPMIGAIIGAWLYKFLIGFQIPDEETDFLKNSQQDLLETGNSSPVMQKSMPV